ncbi:MAG: hypothetical protein HC858_10575, partial [Brachymonas sp.]|nr:hypothetical protein [Brachymonas sp.]
MVGDGLNDAPALGAAHASLSPTSGSDLAQSAADAVFRGERLGPVLDLLRMAIGCDRKSQCRYGPDGGAESQLVMAHILGSLLVHVRQRILHRTRR